MKLSAIFYAAFIFQTSLAFSECVELKSFERGGTAPVGQQTYCTGEYAYVLSQYGQIPLKIKLTNVDKRNLSGTVVEGDYPYGPNVITDREALSEQQVPHFKHFTFGTKISNNSGSFDVVEGYQSFDGLYLVRIGETNKLVTMNKQKLAFRLGKESEIKVNIPKKEISLVLSGETFMNKKDALAIIKETPEKDLKALCEAYFPEGTYNLKDVVVQSSKPTTRREKVGYPGLWNNTPEDTYKTWKFMEATFSASATCTYKRK